MTTETKPAVKASAGGDAGINAGMIWFNGKIVPQEEAKVSVLTHALHYGTSVFEGIRAYPTSRGPAVFRLQEHTQRLFDSALIMRMPVPFSQDEINQAILDTVRVNGWDGCYIRPLIWRGGQTLGVNPMPCPVQAMVATWEWGAYLGEEGKRDGVRANVSSWERISPASLIPAAKACGK